MTSPSKKIRVLDEPLEVSLAELRRMNLAKLRRDEVLSIFESDFPETTIWREGDSLVIEITKMAECVTALLQEQGKGATWMFEDAYAKSRNWKKFTYNTKQLRTVVREAAEWAEQFTKAFAAHQRRVLPWL
jgi:hypothetical protein